MRSISNFLRDGEWFLPDTFVVAFPVLADAIKMSKPSKFDSDRVFWKGAHDGLLRLCMRLSLCLLGVSLFESHSFCILG